MLTNFLLGLPTMVLCLMLQTVLLVVVIRYFLKRQNNANMASLWAILSLWTIVVSSFQCAWQGFWNPQTRPAGQPWKG